MRHERFALPAAYGLLLLVVLFAISSGSGTGAAQGPPASGGLSHVRVVRLSFIQGRAAVRTPGSDGWGEATVNTPIQEGFSLSTDEKSFAEVEFENGSTVRLGELSVIDFTQLALTAKGDHLNHMALEQGYATFDVTLEHHDEYALSVAGVSLTAEGKTEFRVDSDGERMRMEVFSGSVRAADSSHAETLAQNHTLARESSNPASSFQITDKVQQDDWDKWAKARGQQSTLAAKDEAITPPVPGSLYGWDDLDVYGEWNYFPGYGNGWAPYEPEGWSPYAAGMWNWYPGMGYTWISGEPWGWLPFHYGFWNFDAGMGWFWMPGSFGAWNPALVNWYSGPGWIGWSPIGVAGVGGPAPCTLAVAGCLMAVPPHVLSNREPIQPGGTQSVHLRSNEAITAIARPDVAPDRGAAPLQPSFPRSVRISDGRNEGQARGRGPDDARSPAAPSGFLRGPKGAPSSLIMGQRVGQEVFAGRVGVGSGSRGIEPIRVRLGATMGGRFSAAPSDGSRGRSMTGVDEPRDRAGMPAMPGGPRLLPHTSNGGTAHPWSRSSTGGAGLGRTTGRVGARSGSVGSTGGATGSGGGSSSGGSGNAGGGGGHR
jgi:uncharacterized protein DUF6600/FecR-like protein